MRIVARLRLNTWIILAIMSLMVLSLVWSLRESNKAARNEGLVTEMQKTAYERVVLRDEYLMRREERARVQWHAKTEHFQKLLENARGKFTAPRDKTILAGMQKRFDETVLLFSQLADIHEKTRASGYESNIFSEKERQLISYIIVNAYDMMNNINSLGESASRASNAANERSTILVIFFMCLVVILTIGNSVVINRVLMKHITELSEGAEIIGAGNLQHRISANGNDELAELAGTINEMSKKLQESYTSVENLHREINERQQAELLLRESEALLNEVGAIAKIGGWEMDMATSKATWSKGTYDIAEIDYDKPIPGLHEHVGYYLPEYREVIENKMKALVETKQPVKFEAVLKTPKGNIKWCQAFGEAVVKDGKLIKLRGTFQDITERKKAEAALEQYKNHLEELVKERTVELENKIAEIERLNRIFVGRELRMAELKQQLKDLREKEE